VREAEQQAAETKVKAARERKDFAKARQEGVQGMPQVVQASRQVADASRQEADAAHQLAEAHRSEAKARETQSTAAQDYKEKLAELTPAQREFVRLIISLKPEVKDLQRTAAEGLFPGVDKGIKEAIPLLNSMKPVIGATSKELGGLAESAGKALGSAGWQRDLQTIGMRNVGLIHDMGVGTGNLAGAAKDLVVAGGPYTSWLFHAVTGLTQHAAQSAAAARQSGSFARFLDSTKEPLKETAGLFGDLVHEIAGLATANMGNYTQLVRTLRRDVVPVLHELLGDLTSLAPHLNNALSGIAKLAKTLAPGLRPVVSAIGTILDGIGSIARALDGLFKGAPDIVKTMGIAALIAAVLRLKKLIGDVIGALRVTLGLEAAASAGAGAAGGAAGAGAGLGAAEGAAGAAAGTKIFGPKGQVLKTVLPAGEGAAAGAGGGLGLGALGLTPVLPAALAVAAGAAYFSNKGTPGSMPGGGPHFSSKETGADVKAIIRDTQRLQGVRGPLQLGRDLNAIAAGTRTWRGQTLKASGDVAHALRSLPIAQVARDFKRLKINPDDILPHASQARIANLLGSLRQISTTGVSSIGELKTRMAANTDEISSIFKKGSDSWKHAMAANTEAGIKSVVTSMRHGTISVSDGTAEILKLSRSRYGGSKEAASKNFEAAAAEIKKSMDAGLISVKRGTRLIGALMAAELRSYGVDDKEAKKIAKQTKDPNTAFFLAGHQRGGMARVRGSGLDDSVPLSVNGAVRAVVAPQEDLAVINRHQRPMLDQAVSATYGVSGLPGFFDKFDRPHGMAKGGLMGMARQAMASGGYVNPFRHAHVSPSRVDMGVDYTGTGPIEAIGPGVVNAATTASGWPEGGWVSYRIGAGPAKGRYVFVAEGITPTVHAGQKVRAGDEVAKFSGSSIETGWASGVGYQALAAALGQQNKAGDPGEYPTAAGKSFNDLLTSLGAPSGIFGSAVRGKMPKTWPHFAGVGGAALGAIRHIKRVMAKGPWPQGSTVQTLAQSALDRARHFANKRLDEIAAADGGGGGGALGVPPGMHGRGNTANRALGKRLAEQFHSGWGRGPEWAALDDLWGHLEGSWDEGLPNMAGSGAYGIAQALPASKYPPAGQPSAPGGLRKAAAQIGWGLQYIKDRYGDPIGAHAARLAKGWYARGGLIHAADGMLANAATAPRHYATAPKPKKPKLPPKVGKGKGRKAPHVPPNLRGSGGSAWLDPEGAAFVLGQGQTLKTGIAPLHIEKLVDTYNKLGDQVSGSEITFGQKEGWARLDDVLSQDELDALLGQKTTTLNLQTAQLEAAKTAKKVYENLIAAARKRLAELVRKVRRNMANIARWGSELKRLGAKKHKTKQDKARAAELTKSIRGAHAENLKITGEQEPKSTASPGSDTMLGQQQSLLTSLTGSDGIGAMDTALGIGGLPNDINTTKLAIAQLKQDGATKPEGAQQADSALSDLLRQQLAETQKALRVSQAQYDVLTGFAPFVGRFAQGGYVMETGIGQLHRGEYVVSAPGSGFPPVNGTRVGSDGASVEVHLHGDGAALLDRVDVMVDGKLRRADMRQGARSRLIAAAPGR
jgi:hypothetical protein